MNLFEKIWKDQVWSKVIAVIIVGAATFVYSRISQISFENAVKSILLIDIKLWVVLAALLVFASCKWFLNILRTDPAVEKQNELKKFNSYEDKQERILWKWDVYFLNNKPTVDNLEAFCTLHKPAPLRYLARRCPDPTCPNSKFEIDKFRAKNHFESHLIHEWDTMNA